MISIEVPPPKAFYGMFETSQTMLETFQQVHWLKSAECFREFKVGFPLPLGSIFVQSACAAINVQYLLYCKRMSFITITILRQ